MKNKLTTAEFSIIKKLLEKFSTKEIIENNLSDKKYILDTIITDMHLDLFLELKDLFFHKFKQWMFQMPKN